MREFHVLLVEDNPAFRSTLRKTLGERFPGIHVQEASDPSQALLKIHALVPDMVFMDINLAGENGIKLTGRIKPGLVDTSIVILSVHDLPEDRDAAYRNGADGFISKASETFMSDVLSKVEAALSRDPTRPIASRTQQFNAFFSS